ncbi:ABC transporter substrate-binding protein [Caldanaerobius polysaccharolyticus]|uniref:ABC transporter substrate-binding protein n=1 Tax=Caldanaerobius polysaccharolyticus TaxID=44256 RepID=UPI00047C1D21|nr:sugar ABC transporter substrate-binding protein [Caldanaerobius polysaccharolyticus]
MKTKKKKNIVLLSIIFSLILILSSCNSSGSKPSNGSNKDVGKNKQVTIRVQFWAGAEDRELWQQIARDVTKKYPNINVKLETVDWNTYWQKLPAQVAGGTAADVVGIHWTKAREYAQRNALLPLDGYIKQQQLDIDDFFADMLNELCYDGKTYALPYDFGPLILFYNKDMFDKYKVSYPTDKWTWNDLLDAAKKMTNPKNHDFGFALDGAWWTNMHYIISNGGDYVDKSKDQITFNNPKAIESIQWFADLINVYHVAPTLSDLTANSLSDRWYAGHIGMYYDGPWSLINTKKNTKFNFAVAPTPLSPTSGKRTTYVQGSGFGIYAKTKYPEEAFKVVSYFTSKEALSLLAKNGRAFPARKSVQEEYYKGAANVPGAQEALEKCLADEVAPYVTANWTEADNFITQNVLQPIYFGKAKAADIIPKMDQQIREISSKVTK